MLIFRPYIIRLHFALLIVMLSGGKGIAQHNHQERLYYFGSKSLNEQSKLSFGSGWHAMPADQWNRLELRTTYFYTIKPWLQVGYGQRSNFAFEEGTLSNYELRPFQTVNFYQNVFANSKITHRFMLEERIIFNKNDENNFQGRLRYRLELKKPIVGVESLYFRPMTELFYSVEGNNNTFTQWKNTIAFGYSLQRNIKIEARYEYMVLNKGDVTPDFENLNGYRIQLIHYF